MIKVSVGDVIEYYDCPQIFTAVSNGGRLFVCVLLWAYGDDIEFVGIEINDKELEAIFEDVWVIRELMLSRKNAFLCKGASSWDDLSVEEVFFDEFPEEWLIKGN